MNRDSNWDPGAYDSTHHYVTDYGRSLLDVLAPQPGERVLDAGCGTGHLSNEIAQRGSKVLGIDSSPEMVAQARQNYPALQFQLTDLAKFSAADELFDAVFSNAVLHWVQPPEPAAAAMRAALKPGGRLVVEFGGKGNIRSIIEATGRNPWYFPGIAEYAHVLESNGFEVATAALFDRPTRVEGANGLQEWVAMFYKPPLASEVVERMTTELRPSLYREGAWFIDYRRLRITARAV